MEKELAKLSETAGVDLVAIREKYKNRAAASATAASTNPDTNSTMRGQEELDKDEEIDKLKKEIGMIAAMKQLDNYTVCKHCHGVGTVIEIYNHFRMERNCPECDGESVSQRVPIIPGIND